MLSGTCFCAVLKFFAIGLILIIVFVLLPGMVLLSILGVLSDGETIAEL